jgi:hypothetical protein
VRHRSIPAIGILAVGLLFPNLVGWYGLAWMIEADRPRSTVPTPNPVVAPIYYLSPTEALVYFDPYWAAFGYLWFLTALAIPAALVAWTVLSKPSFTATGVAGLAAGCLLATPWLLGIAGKVFD